MGKGPMTGRRMGRCTNFGAKTEKIRPKVSQFLTQPRILIAKLDADVVPEEDWEKVEEWELEDKTDSERSVNQIF